MYRDHKNWRQHQVFVETEWEGGIYATPTLPGSRSGRDIAALWAVMAHLGKQGYIDETRKIIETTRALTQAIREDEILQTHLKVMGDPKMMVIGIASKDPEVLNIYDLIDEMKKMNWYLSGLQKPAGIHFCTTAVQGNNPDFVKGFVKDLKKCIQIVLNYSPEKKAKSGDAAMYCTNEKFGEKMFIDDMAREFWDITLRVKPLTFDLEIGKN